MATITININAADLLAVDDTHITTNKTLHEIDVLANDQLGIEPTVILSVDQTGFTLGTVAINSTFNALEIDPNGTIGTDTVTYTIKDSNGDESTATVTITINP